MRITTMLLVVVAACAGDANTGDTGGSSDPSQLCTNTCQYNHDGQCDDGAPGADTADCDYGTDCADCGPRPVTVSTCTCDTTTACDAGCTCDPQCGTKALGTSCVCADGSDVCSDTECASLYCLWYDGVEGYCSQQCGSCPSGFTCNGILGLGDYCVKTRTIPPCGACTDSSDCEPFPVPSGEVDAACFDGRCRMRCDSNSGSSFVPATPMGGGAVGYCSDDGC